MSKLIDVAQGKVSLSGALNRDTLTEDAWEILSIADRTALKDAQSVVVELANVEHLDSAGLAWLVNFKRDANTHAVALTFSSAPENIAQLAALSGVGHFFQTPS